MCSHRALCLADERGRAGISLKAAAPSAGAFLAARADDHVAQLARRAGVAREHFAVQHHAAADACAKCDSQCIVCASKSACLIFAVELVDIRNKLPVQQVQRYMLRANPGAFAAVSASPGNMESTDDMEQLFFK